VLAGKYGDEMRNRPNYTTILGITCGALIGLGLLVWRTSTPSIHADAQSAETVAADKKTAQRRLRKGPRKPPAVSTIPSAPPTDLFGEEDTSGHDAPTKDAQDAQDDQRLTEQERKLEEYLEHLDAIDDPNVDELTMLGEMAFDANQAEAAYEHYLEVIEEHTDDPNAPFALYKLAWTEYNLGDVEAAIDDMALVIEWVGDGETQMHEVLRTQGTKDLDMFGTPAD
jgi:tetratricopeptide (TPR) repeat protein